MRNRDDIYLVVRKDFGVASDSHVCGVYRLLESADADAAAYNQKWKDRGWEALGKFEVRIATYYDE